MLQKFAVLVINVTTLRTSGSIRKRKIKLKQHVQPRRMTPDQIDLIQVGWLAAWVLHCEGEYHEKKFQDSLKHP